MIDALRRYGGTQSDILDNPRLMRMLLPSIRADLQMNDRYRYVPEDPLECPTLALHGDADTITASEASEWRVQTMRWLGLQIFRGGHFFIAQHTAQVVRAICRSVAPRALDIWS